jgi:excinuclease ABC subunit C
VRESLQILQKIFPARQCEDSFYNNRTRPCLQYQIKRCTAPCVEFIDQESYKRDVEHAIKFLEGKSQEVITELVEQMTAAADALDFEKAAVYRDQISQLRRIQEKQYVDAGTSNIDVIAAAQRDGMACVQVFFIRNGQNLGSKHFFPKHTKDCSDSEILAAFIPQYYLGKFIPNEIIVSDTPEEKNWLENVLSQQMGRKVALVTSVRGERAKWLEMAKDNAVKTLTLQLMSKNNLQKRVLSLQQALDLTNLPRRLECFDISHTFGEETVASCVVFEDGTPLKSDYRRFNIKGIVAGDDYEAMRQALLRRYKKLKQGEGKLPDLLIIDGGRGQVNAALTVLGELQISNVTIIGVSKGEGRKPGLETLHIADTGEIVNLPSDSPALHLIQSIRDEAHRFAITGHRQRRDKARKRSVLEDIEGLGPKRRRALLSQLGGLQEVGKAGIEDIARVPGISHSLAQRIYDLFHGENEQHDV